MILTVGLGALGMLQNPFGIREPNHAQDPEGDHQYDLTESPGEGLGREGAAAQNPQ